MEMSGPRPDPPAPQPADPAAAFQQPAFDLDEFLRRRAANVQHPSRRVPHMSWYLNDADQIEVQLEQDGHSKWGFVIYRTAYDSDEDWTEFLRRLRVHMEANFDACEGRDILDQFELTVFDDSSMFDGATSDTVRRHFQTWSVTNFPSEQPAWQGGNTVRLGNSPRYRFAIQVDKESLHACVHEATNPDEGAQKDGWVKLIDKSWYLGRGVGDSFECEPLEGITAQDVGWIRVSFMDVLPHYYANLWTRNSWTTMYQRPPQVIGS